MLTRLYIWLLSEKPDHDAPDKVVDKHDKKIVDDPCVLKIISHDTHPDETYPTPPAEHDELFDFYPQATSDGDVSAKKANEASADSTFTKVDNKPVKVETKVRL